MAPSCALALLALTAASLVAAETNDPTCTTHAQPQLGKHMALVQLTNRLRTTGAKPASTLTDFERDYIEDGRGPCCEENRAECLSCADDMAVVAWCEDPEHAAVPGCEDITTPAPTEEGSAHHSGAHRGSAGHGNANGDADGSRDADASGAGHGDKGHGGANHSVTAHGGGSAGHGGHNGHNDQRRRSSSTTTSSTTTASTTTSPECVTREDPRVSAVGYTTSAPGTPCIFGVDARDEGSHCIPDNGDYGSFGWCYTSEAADSWGSCAESCPLFGPHKVLDDRIKRLEKKLAKAMRTTTTSTTTVTTTTSTEEPTTTEAANITTEAPSTPAAFSTTIEEPSTTVTTMSTTLQVNASANESTNVSANASANAPANEASRGPGAKAAESGGPGAKGKAGGGGHGPSASAEEGPSASAKEG